MITKHLRGPSIYMYTYIYIYIYSKKQSSEKKTEKHLTDDVVEAQ